MKIGVADYGMNVWYGGLYDTEGRLEDLKRIGYDGLERLEAASPSDALLRAAMFKRLGMDFATCRGPSIEANIKWTAGLGKSYIWAQSSAKDFGVFCRQVNDLAKAAARYGVKVGLHNHLGSVVESQEQLESFMKACPDVGLIFDTGHLAAADGDCLGVVKKFHKRLVALHLKDWFVTDATIGLDKWYERGRFCELGAGNIGQDNAAVLKAAVAAGYDGWVHIEHDTHLRDPLADLAVSREYLRKAGV